MLITRTSSISGLEHDLDIPISPSELLDLELNEESTVWDKLDADQAEFILDGFINFEIVDRFKE